MKHRHPAVLAALFVAVTVAPACRHTFQKRRGPTDEQLVDLYATTATYLYEDDSLIRAQDQAVKVLEIDPDHRPMRRMIAWIRLRMGSNEDLIIAEQFFRQLRRERDENDATLLGLATALERLGTAYDQASREFASGERQPAEGVDAEAQTRDLALKARDYWHESLELYQQTVHEGEGSTNGMNGLQRVYALLGRYDDSLGWSERLLERSAEEMAVWRRLLTQQELTEREEQLYRENERMAADLQLETRLFAASLLHRLGRDAEAIEELGAAVILRPELAQLYSRRAQLLGAVGEHERAIEDLDRFLRLSDEPFEHPNVQRAFKLRTQCERELDPARRTARN